MVDEVTTETVPDDRAAAPAAPPPFDDETWRVLLEHVAPVLRTYPSVAAWVPGCGDGAQAAWAVAALVDSAGLLGRTRIYATDADEGRVAAAAEREPPEHAPPGAKERVVYCAHSLETDASLNEFQLVVLGPDLERALTDPGLRARALGLVRDSLCLRGVVVASGGLAADLDQDGGYERMAPETPVLRRRA